MDIIENRKNSFLVTTSNTQWTLVAKHEDENGEYFYNEYNKKQYAKDTPVVEHPIDVAKRKREQEKAKQSKWANESKDEFKTYKFDVTTANKYGEPARNYEKSIRAKTLEEATEKLNSHYKRIFDSFIISINGKDVTIN